ncbi:hypothetical protein [Halioxenophilus sp. WMMB6]|uniref:hypothetical protein n=1 Tax=Halioxenophilus sp. WMMB6 TaxID=3073815 RepID=UPI00295F01B6|nr:hypothetical protein [Halioxenophilus sp. WMMB6]
MQAISCHQAWQNMTRSARQGSVRNYCQLLDMADYCVETELFPLPVLEAYTAWNLELPISEAQHQLFSNLRGGGQGDYRQGMQRKIANVVDCLSCYPASKRAVITIGNDAFAAHSDDDQAKCMRELHCYLDDDNRLSATVFFRAQAALIFPKNIHFIGSLMRTVAAQLPGQPQLGTLFYLTTILVADRA